MVPDRALQRSRPPYRAVAYGGAVVVAVLGLLSGMPPTRHLTDFGVYRRAAHAVARGIDVYAPNGSQFRFTYPPFAGEFVLPLTAVPSPVAAYLLTALTIAAGLYVVHASLAPARVLQPDRAADERGPGWTHALAAPVLTVALLWSEPMRITTWLGQINAILVALVVADATGRLARLPRGVLTGLAIGVKLTPGTFVLAAAGARRYRFAATATATFLVTILAGAVVQPGAARAYWTDLLWHTDRVGQVSWYGNQSILGALTRLFGDGALTRLLWLAVAAVVLAAGLRAAARVHADGNVILSVGVVGTVSTLLSPISWTHHWLWCVPVFGGLLARAGRCRWAWLAAAAWLTVFEVGPNTRLAHVAFGWTPSRLIVGNDYVLAGVALLAVLAVRPAAAPVGSGQQLDRRAQLTDS